VAGGVVEKFKTKLDAAVYSAAKEGGVDGILSRPGDGSWAALVKDGDSVLRWIVDNNAGVLPAEETYRLLSSSGVIVHEDVGSGSVSVTYFYEDEELFKAWETLDPELLPMDVEV
jgi:hypothetical protein